ncbi:hypothetical protein DFP72DRAFT_184536 [Ephemerocybe angulata]|uniref:Uncharacterized protein n=1 Tax=Ephemerocybe angulata TaxID=980116 RepID=A0A8H6HA22_9AGAR|nr:hypothetical protein DFP72DRAFT_184536 [Tulosesus angulatus]
MYWTSRGIWFKLVRNVKRMRSSLTEEVRSIAMVKTAVAWDALTRKITIRVEGEYVEGPLLTLFLRQSSLSFTSSTSPLLASSTPTTLPSFPLNRAIRRRRPPPLASPTPSLLASSFGVVHAYPLGCWLSYNHHQLRLPPLPPSSLHGSVVYVPQNPLARIVSVCLLALRQVRRRRAAPS